jgi:hypothetical protein
MIFFYVKDGSPKGGNMSDGTCVYFLNGQLCIRAASSLSGDRVKEAPEFANTRIHAAFLAQAATIGSRVYKDLSAKEREQCTYRSLTGRAIKLLKTGVNEEEVVRRLKGKE